MQLTETLGWLLSVTLAVAGIADTFQSAGPQVVQEAVVVAWCESRLDASAKSQTGDYGLFQINRRVHQNIAPNSVWSFDASSNLEYAKRLYDQRNGWGAWACKPHPSQRWTAQVFAYDADADRWVCCKGSSRVPASVRKIWWSQEGW